MADGSDEGVADGSDEGVADGTTLTVGFGSTCKSIEMPSWSLM